MHESFLKKENDGKRLTSESSYFTDLFKSFCDNLNLKITLEKPEYNKNGFSDKKFVALENLAEYFKKNFECKKPINIIINDGLTLFICAGVQHLDSVIHQESETPDSPFFVSQPVIRTQYLGSKEPASYTSFYNPTTLACRISFEKHLEYLQIWINFLLENGFKKELFKLEITESEPKLGKRKYKNYPIKIYYSGLEMGDAVFIPHMPQDSRDGFSISDIGFGLERINHFATGDKIEAELFINDYLRTLTLLAVSGVKPGNKEHGYRFRLFSKKLINECGLNYNFLVSLLSNIDEYFEIWSFAKTVCDKEEAHKLIRNECERKKILDYIKEDNVDIEININQKTQNFFDQLSKTGTRSVDYWVNLKNKICL